MDSLEECFEELWKIKIPSKIAVFAWRLFRDRLPTKSNLRARQVQISDIYHAPFAEGWRRMHPIFLSIALRSNLYGGNQCLG